MPDSRPNGLATADFRHTSLGALSAVVDYLRDESTPPGCYGFLLADVTP